MKKLGIGHAPRFHLNLFSPRCRWPCIQQAPSTIGSNSTCTSLLDNNQTSSWTYIHYNNNNDEHENSEHGSTLNDIELISLINQGSVSDPQDNEEGLDSSQNDLRELLTANSSDRNARRDVRTLFPENSGDAASSSHENHQEGDPSSDCGGAAASGGNPLYMNWSLPLDLYNYVSESNSISNEQTILSDRPYVNLPITRECVPVFIADNNSTCSSRGSNSNDNQRHLPSSVLFNDPGDLLPGGDHPYGIPSSFLGGVLLNVDNQYRLSANSAWENWGEFITEGAIGSDSERNSATGREAGRNCGASGDNEEAPHRSSGISYESFSSETEGLISGGSNCDTLPSISSEEDNQSVDDPPLTSLINSPEEQAGHVPLPHPPSISSSGSSSNGSLSQRQQQDWYFYDPRLVPENRTERVTLQTSFRGLRNRCFMSSIIHPPAYEDIIQGPDGSGASGENDLSPQDVCIDLVDNEPPPPYTVGEPPPSYEQTFGSNLTLPSFNFGLNFNPLGRRLAVSLGTGNNIIPMSGAAEPDLLMDVDIDELLGGTSPSQVDEQIEETVTMTNDAFNESVQLSQCITAAALIHNRVNGEEGQERNNNIIEDTSNLTNDNGHHNGESDIEENDTNFSLQRYPVGFCLGRRPPVRWSRAMSPNRWASTENWALN